MFWTDNRGRRRKNSPVNKNKVIEDIGKPFHMPKILNDNNNSRNYKSWIKTVNDEGIIPKTDNKRMFLGGRQYDHGVHDYTHNKIKREDIKGYSGQPADLK